MKCWGGNYSGNLGDGSIIDRLIPFDVSGLSENVTAVSAGGSHTCAIHAGALKCWGSNLYGRLGDGTEEDRHVPTGVMGLDTGAVDVSIGNGHTCALLDTGGLKCWGYNAEGQLGTDDQNHRTTPADVSGIASGAAQVDCGYWHTCARMSATNGLKCWGQNQEGQVGDRTTFQKLVPVDVYGLSSGTAQVEAGGKHTCAVLDTGLVKCWGRNFDGNLGDGTTENRNTPVQVSGLTTGVSDISVGVSHTCALLDTGAAKCWGENTFGSLGDGTYGPAAGSTVPVDVTIMSSTASSLEAGYSFTCALLDTNVVECWGSNGSGQVNALFPGYPGHVACN